MGWKYYCEIIWRMVMVDYDPKKIDQPSIEYNGYSFFQVVPESDEGSNDGTYTTPPRYDLQGTIIYDDAGRTPIYTRYVLTVESIAYTEDNASQAGQNLGDAMADLSELLTAPHKELNIHSIGLPITNATGVADVLWGVKPLGIKFTPVAGQAAAFLTWAVEFNIVTAVDQQIGKTNNRIFYALNFSNTWDIDEHGLTTRTVTGYYQVRGKVTTAGKRFAKEVADNLRDKLQIPIPVGFRRINQTWSENLSRERMNFSVSDRQFEWNTFPVYCTKADGTFTIFAKLPGAATGGAELEVTYELAPGINKSIAAIHFLRAAFDRQKVLEKGLRTGIAAGPGAVIPQMNTVTIGQFDRKVSYSLSWKITGCITDLMYGNEIFQPVKYGASTPDPTGYITKADWKKWSNSVWQFGGTVTNRGVAQLEGYSDDGELIDPTSQKTAVSIGYGIVTTKKLTKLKKKFMCPDVPPAYSYLTYDCNFQVITRNNVTMRKYMTPLNYIQKTAEQALVSSPDGIPDLTYTPADKGYRQYAEYSEGSYFLVMKFKSMRVQYKPAIPEPKNTKGLKFEGDIELLKKYSTAKTEIIGSAGCHPVYLTLATCFHSQL